MALIRPQKGERVLDVTLGLGGHAKAFLDHIGESGTLIGLDADRENLEAAGVFLRAKKARNVQLLHANFRDLPSLRLPHCDILLADLGLSSPHLDIPERGFSFRSDAPLDSRFDRSKGKTAAELLASSSEHELHRIFREYGEVPGSARLARAIRERREQGKPPDRTRELVDIVSEVYGWKATSLLPQIFQALRIAVNDEIDALTTLLEYGPTLLSGHGRMAIISYHSLEDRLVKERFRELSTPEKHPLTGAPLKEASFRLLTKRAIQAENPEVERNPRARSARLRAIGRTP